MRDTIASKVDVWIKDEANCNTVLYRRISLAQLIH